MGKIPVFHVVAMAEGRVIGRDNNLPWHFPADLKFFKQLTTGHTVIMGRKTYDSIGRPLPNRDNFVLTRGPAPVSAPAGVRYFSRLTDALDAVKTEKCFIIGGAEIFRQTLDRVDGVYLTRIHARYEGDVFYPELPPDFAAEKVAELQAEPLVDVWLYRRGKSV